MCELEGGKAKLDRGLSWSGGDRGWVLHGGVVLGGSNGDGGRRSRAQGGEWGLGLGGMERRGGVPVEAAGVSRTEVATRRGGGAGIEAEAEAAAAHQDGSGGGGQASRWRRRGGERSRRRGGGGG